MNDILPDDKAKKKFNKINGNISGVYSDNKSTESGSTGSNGEVEELAIIEEAIAEAERDIAEAIDLLSGTETELKSHETKM